MRGTLGGEFYMMTTFFCSSLSTVEGARMLYVFFLCEYDSLMMTMITVIAPRQETATRNRAPNERFFTRFEGIVI